MRILLGDALPALAAALPMGGRPLAGALLLLLLLAAVGAGLPWRGGILPLAASASAEAGEAMRAFDGRFWEAPTALGLALVDEHFGMCRSATSTLNLRPQWGQGVRSSSTSGKSAGGASPRCTAAAVFSAFWNASCCAFQMAFFFSFSA